MPVAEILHQLRATWSPLAVSQVFTRRCVVCVDSSQTAEAALDVLVANSIHAAPVYSKVSGTYCGTITLRDVAAYVASLLRSDPTIAHAASSSDDDEDEAKEPEDSETNEQCLPSSSGTGWAKVPPITTVMARLRGNRTPPTTIADLCRHDQFTALPEDASMLAALEMLAKGAHCIFVSAKAAADPPKASEGNDTPGNNLVGKLVGVLTQGDVVRYVCAADKAQTAGPFAGLLACRLSELGLGLPRDLVAVKSYQRVAEALCEMQANGVSSIAVVDPQGRLLGNISTSDVKHISSSIVSAIRSSGQTSGDPEGGNCNGCALFETCVHFINVVKTRTMLANGGKDSAPVIQVSPNALIGQVLRLMLVTNVHRVWVSDSNAHSPTFQFPTSVVSMTDVMRVTI